MAKVSMIESGRVAGVWAETSDGDGIGLVAEEGLGAYLMVYPKHLEGRRMPFAIGAMHHDHEIDIQIPTGETGEHRLEKVRIIPIRDLLNLLAPPPPV